MPDVKDAYFKLENVWDPEEVAEALTVFEDVVSTKHYYTTTLHS